MTLTLIPFHLLNRLRISSIKDNYTQFVQVMKVALPALALLLMAVVVIWAKLAAQTDGFRIGYAAITQDSVKNLRMLNARYFGVDANNNPYSVTADSGAQRPDDPDLIDMEAPKADFVSHSGATVIISADHGTFHQHTQILDLQDNVNLYHESGYELHTQIAHVNLKTNEAEGELPVDGHGPQGRVNGTGFRLLEKGERIVVTGRSTLSLQSDHGKGKSK